MEKYGKDITLAVCYPEVFKAEAEQGVKLISIGEAQAKYTNIEAYNIYGWMQARNWKNNLTAAYRGMYGINSNQPIFSSFKE